MSKYFSFSNMIAGFVAVMVGFASSAALVFQAATAAGATPAEINSWLFALGMSIALSCISLSLYYRIPILVGWSTPGAALLATSLTGTPMPEAIGAFMFAALLTCFFGATGLLERAIKHLPRSLSSAMLAGILIHYGMNVFTAMHDQFTLIAPMILAYLIGKRVAPRYVIILVLITGVLVAGMQGLFHLESLHSSFAVPVFTAPVFSLPVLISIGIPLFIVTMTSQNIPGIAVLYSAGFNPSVSSLISWTGLMNLLWAPFGSFSICLAAITAAICASKEADQEPENRYKATVFAGICWAVIAVFGATIVALFFAFPKELILALAGLALISTIASSLKTAFEEDSQRESALITFLITASGLSFAGIGSAFWGLAGGIIASAVLNWGKGQYSPATGTATQS